MKFFNFFNKVKSDNPLPVRRSIGMSGGTQVNPDSAMEASAFYRGVIYISSQISKLPWEVKDKDNKVLKNDIHYLLNVSPNPEMTAFHFKLFLLQCAILHGNGYAEIERTIDGRVVNMWPLNPNRVSPIRNTAGELYYQVVNGSTSSETVYLKPKDLFIVRNIHTKDAIQGQGVIGYAMQTLGISLGADRFANALFANGGMPSGVLEHPGQLSDEAYKRLVDSWKEQQGGRKTGSTAILEEGVKYSPISHAPDVLQFLESRKFSVLEIARFLGLPPTKLFDSDSAKFNNIEHANLEVATDTLDTWARNLESEADMKLLSGRHSDKRTELDLYAVFRGDMNTRSQYFSRMMQSGAITPNEIRTKEGLAPYDGGDRYYIATNNFSPADRIDELLDSQIESKNNKEGANNTVEKESAVDKAVATWLINKSTKDPNSL
jgi:HK97 family phage portal protein